MRFTAKVMARIMGGKLIGEGNLVVRSAITDTREANEWRGGAFFALRGIHRDGIEYVDLAYRSGARVFVVSRENDATRWVIGEGGTAVIVVADVLRGLQMLAAENRRRFRGIVIGITGSNGKTIVKEWLYDALKERMRVVRSPRSYNSQLGVALSLLLLDNSYEVALIEAGISKPSEMARLHEMIIPEYGVFTHLGSAHDDGFVSRQEKALEKCELFVGCHRVFFKTDDKEVEAALKEEKFCDVRKRRFGKGTRSWVQLVEAPGETARIKVRRQEFEIRLPLRDSASVENILAVIAVLDELGFDAGYIKERVEAFVPVAMRVEIKKGRDNCVLINDCYSADLDSLVNGIEVLRRQDVSRKTLIVTDIAGRDSFKGEIYREIAGRAVEMGIRRVVGIGLGISGHREAFCGLRGSFYDSTEALLQAIEQKREVFEREAVLLKGARRYALERVVAMLEEKIHKTVLEVNLTAMSGNYNYFRSLLRPSTKLVVMVKASAYGMGAVEVGRMLERKGVDYLAVAFADEGVELRKAGIRLPIMLMNPESGTYDVLIKNGLEPEIYGFGMLANFMESCKKGGVKNYPIHIKLDTGMHRLGFMEGELGRLGELLRGQEEVRVVSVFSHLAGSDEAAFEEFTRGQIGNFERMTGAFEGALGYKFMRHILNSAGIERWGGHQFDMVRLGIGLYGFSAIKNAEVKQVARLKTVILQIKSIAEGESVGYSRRFMARRPTRVGIIPIGYGDGLSRRLGNSVGSVTVCGKAAAIIGNVCMDVCMIDLSDCLEAKEGDEVVVFDGNLDILAEQMGTIPYEVMTSISSRVERVYYEE